MNDSRDTDRGLVGLLRRLGYPDEDVRRDYRVMTGRTHVTADLVAFGTLPHDLASALIVGENQATTGDIAINRTLTLARALAAPAALVADSNRITILNTSDDRVVLSLQHDEEPSDELRNQLAPRRLLAAKQRSQQLSLFPIDVNLLRDARRTATDRLNDRVVAARTSILDELPNLRKFESDAELTARLLIDGLTALFVEDKFDAAYGTSEWWELATSRFAHMANALESYDKRTLSLFERVRNELRNGVDYRSLDSVVVADLYEPRLVDAGDRNEHGIVYTPHDLATQAMARIPIELIAPEDRHVWDLACGSGTLLLASHDRLAAAVDDITEISPRHDYLLRHLHGSDRDPFAVRLAHLSLSIHGFPQSNGWDVEAGDSLVEPPRTTPSIVFANPPWRGIRSARESDGTRHRRDQSVRFVERALDALPGGGLLGMFVPASTLDAISAGPLRERITSTADLLEVWRLPENAFVGASVRGAFIVARTRTKDDKATTHHLQRRIRHQSTADHGATEKPAAPQAATDKLRTIGTVSNTRLNQVIETLAENPEGSATWGHTSATTKFIAKCREFATSDRASATPPNLNRWTVLSDWVEIRTGPSTSRKTAHNRRQPDEAPFRHLRSVRYLKQFTEISAAATEAQPSDLDPSSFWKFDTRYETDKLLVSRVARADQPWRLAVYFAFTPVVPSNNQYALTLKRTSGDTHEDRKRLAALGAVLSSALVNVWVDWQMTGGNLRTDLLGATPLPPQWHKLGPEALRVITRFEPSRPSRSATPAKDQDRLRRISRLNDRVDDLYGVPSAVAAEMNLILSGTKDRNGIRWDRGPVNKLVVENTSETASWRSAAVLTIEDAVPVIWVDGITEPDGEPMPWWPKLPGATLLPECTYLAGVDSEDRLTGEVRLQPHAYQDIDDLLQSWAASPDE